MTTYQLNDAVGEWWISPAGVYLLEPYPRTVLGGIAANGDIVVGELRHDTETTTRVVCGSAAVDDHNVPAVWTEQGHPIVVAWTQHNLDSTMHFRVSNPAGTVESLASAPAQSWTNPAGLVSYTQIHRIAHESTATHDRLWVFFRLVGGEWQYLPVTLELATGALTFGTAVTVFGTNPPRQAYLTTADAYAETGPQIIRCAFGYNPSQPVETIYGYELDVASGDITDAATGALMGNARTGVGLPVLDSASTPLVAEPADGISRRLFYVRPGPDLFAVAYAEWDETAPDAATYKVVTVNADGSKTTTDYGVAGPRVGYTEAANYIAGMAFETPSTRGRVITAHSSSGSESVVVHDPGSDDVVVYSGPTSAGRLIRPNTPVNGANAHVEVIFTRMTAYDGYQDYQGQLVALETYSITDPGPPPWEGVTIEAGVEPQAGRVAVTVEGGPEGVPLFVLRRQGGTTEVVRETSESGVLWPAAGPVTVHDYEATQSTELDYMVSDEDGRVVASTRITTPLWGTWLKSPGRPYRNLRVFYGTDEPMGYPARRVVIDVQDSAQRIVFAQRRAGVQSTVRLITRTEQDAADLLALVSDGTTLMLDTPPTWGVPLRYISVGDVSAARAFEQDGLSLERGERLWELSDIVSVESPQGAPIADPYRTYAELPTLFDTYLTLSAITPTYEMLATGEQVP